jgi:serine/threonine-protein kinase
LDETGIEIGQKIGDYEIVRKLGAGGLGMVYEARHLISQRAEAMKVLLPSQTARRRWWSAFGARFSCWPL